jgi:hypothetical protein
MSFAFNMPTLLHILTEPDDALAQEIIAKQNSNPENKIEIVDLTKPEPDYKKLLENIFAADSVQVW